jgi:O-methyltransferase
MIPSNHAHGISAECAVTRLRVRGDAFLLWKGDTILLGHQGSPFSALEIPPGAVVMLARFHRGQDPKDVIAELAADEAAAQRLERLVASLRENGILVEADSTSATTDVEGWFVLDAARLVNACPDLAHVDPAFNDFEVRCRPYTLSPSPASLFSLYGAARHLTKARVAGDIVECGVWRGGSMMMAALTLAAHADTNRKIYLYDTFALTWETPSSQDAVVYHPDAPLDPDVGSATLAQGTSVEAVMANLGTTGYPIANVVPVKGLVQETIPATMPERIALLRLDTDLYESTYHELVHLYPRLVSGGVLIIDDYGKFAGATRAVDQYFEENGIAMLLHRVDLQGRIGIKA